MFYKKNKTKQIPARYKKELSMFMKKTKASENCRAQNHAVNFNLTPLHCSISKSKINFQVETFQDISNPNAANQIQICLKDISLIQVKMVL